MKQLVGIALVGLMLSACTVTKDRELPDNSGSGADEMKISPCVSAGGGPCAPVDYESRGYKWVG